MQFTPTSRWPELPQAEFLCPEGYQAVYQTNATTRHGEHGNALLSRWPVVSHGINYDGTVLTPDRRADGVEQPAWFWRPSIGVSGLAFYDGDRFPPTVGARPEDRAAAGAETLQRRDGRALPDDVERCQLGEAHDELAALHSRGMHVLVQPPLVGGGLRH